MSAIVLKFGGSSFLRPEDYGRVAAHIAERLADDASKVVTVVSAMSGTTGNLKAVMLDVNDRASASSLDSALATGEMLSASLLEAAVSQLGISVTSLYGYSLGLRTNSDFGRASIEEIDPGPLRAALRQHDVVIAAGGQAIDRSGRLTMLGRNSSDLTATVIAGMLEAENCEIYSDVCGVYSADPYIIPGAQLILELAYDTIRQMSRHGAKVLHYRAVDHAEEHQVSIVCKSLLGNEVTRGTTVSHRGDARAVVVARDAVLLRYADVVERDRARSTLARLDLNAIAMDADESAGICLTTDAEFALSQLEPAANAPMSIQQSNLVTEFSSSAPRLYLEADFDSAVALARSIHHRLYPAITEGEFSWSGTKQRSAFSSLLTSPGYASSDRPE